VERVLVVPAAGSGSRLGAATPKLLAEVNGRPMIAHILDLYARVAERTVIVVAPGALAEVRAVLGQDPNIAIITQQTPSGMLDAILLAQDEVRAASPRRVLITWCDQIAIAPATVAAVVSAAAGPLEPPVVMPVCHSPDPYVHLVRDAAGRIAGVLHRREGDDMPAAGESDAGVFDLSRDAYLEWLTEYAQRPEIGARTGERNFVPFVAWAARRGPVATIPCASREEAVGINTPEELAAIASYLRWRAQQ
jgi:bifunctional UDP-N-acetylglucosamine pyrophosphorylase / glucosamine-1-phosphate N-acetyltransferase